jgi:hypothetical protein
LGYATLLAGLFRAVELPVARQAPVAADAALACFAPADARPRAARAAAALGARFAVECGLPLVPNTCSDGAAAAVAVAAAAAEATTGPVEAMPDVRALARFERPADASPPLEVTADRVVGNALCQAVLPDLPVNTGDEPFDPFASGSGLSAVEPPRIAALAAFRPARPPRDQPGGLLREVIVDILLRCCSERSHASESESGSEYQATWLSESESENENGEGDTQMY